MKLSNYAKQIGISYNTAWRMWKRGQLPGYQLPTGTVIVEPPEQKPRSTTVRRVAVYARVGSLENKKNLETQAERLISWCNAPSLVRLQGGQRVWQRDQRAASQVPGRGFLIPRSARLWSSTKIGRPALEWPTFRRCLRGLGRDLVVVNTADTAEDDLMGDFVAIITSFAARLYGRRPAKRKTQQVLAARPRLMGSQ